MCQTLCRQTALLALTLGCLAHTIPISFLCLKSYYSLSKPGALQTELHIFTTLSQKNPKASFCLSQTLYLSVVTLVPLCKGAPYTTASLEIQENQHHQGVKDR